MSCSTVAVLVSVLFYCRISTAHHSIFCPILYTVRHSFLSHSTDRQYAFCLVPFCYLSFYFSYSTVCFILRLVITSFCLILLVPFWERECLASSRSSLCLSAYTYVPDLSYRILFEQYLDGAGANPLGMLSGAHQTKLAGWHVQPHGSVDERHVPGDDGHSSPRLFYM